MSVHSLTTGIAAVPIAKAGAGGENVDALVADVIRPLFIRRYRYLKRGPLRSIFRYF
ncbi:hypothetical protein [Pleomorphomonas sp. PLEO]|uniref:hypothetical protein n=1 Tax=Pleomorphomonas sp. PLEO TaxID=3239306 RepID=UPI00351DBEC4